MIRAVLDTNVIVSGFLHPGGIPDLIIQAWKANLFALCLSPPVYAEIAAVLKRPKIRRLIPCSDPELAEFLELLAKISVFVDEPLKIVRVVRDDPADDSVLATALAAKADVIVSGDHHLLELRQYEGIPIVGPRAFLELLGQAGRET